MARQATAMPTGKNCQAETDETLDLQGFYLGGNNLKPFDKPALAVFFCPADKNFASAPANENVNKVVNNPWRNLQNRD